WGSQTKSSTKSFQPLCCRLRTRQPRSSVHLRIKQIGSTWGKPATTSRWEGLPIRWEPSLKGSDRRGQAFCFWGTDGSTAVAHHDGEGRHGRCRRDAVGLNDSL